RGATVTGVQTCALPISHPTRRSAASFASSSLVVFVVMLILFVLLILATGLAPRRAALRGGAGQGREQDDRRGNQVIQTPCDPPGDGNVTGEARRVALGLDQEVGGLT